LVVSDDDQWTQLVQEPTDRIDALTKKGNLE
jgi:hypothetical protein